MRQDRLIEIVGRIYQNPDCWSQDTWHCDSTHCIAGHAQIDSGEYNKLNHEGGLRPYFAGRSYLELTQSQADILFYKDWTLEEIVDIAISGVISEDVTEYRQRRL